MHMSDPRSERLAHLRDLIAQQAVANQAEIVAALQQAGFSCTQSSVSRDLADLNALKKNGRYVLAPSGPTLDIVSVEPAGPNLLVVKTPIGAASLIGVQIDSLNLSQIVGTIAGDDTIFIATANADDQAVVTTLLQHNL